MFIKNLKLESRFNGLLAIVFIIGMTIASSLLFGVFEQNAEAEITSKAKPIVETINSVRDYTTSNVEINYLLRRAVIRPIRNLSRTAEAISLGDLDAEFEHQNQDEIGVLATAFNRMNSSFKISMSFLDRGGNRLV
jgi:HAMP domain-containing protein